MCCSNFCTHSHTVSLLVLGGAVLFYKKRRSKGSLAVNLSFSSPPQQTLDIVTKEDTDFDVMQNPITAHSFQDSPPVELNAPTKPSPVGEESSQTSHHEMEEKETEKKGEDELPQ